MKKKAIKTDEYAEQVNEFANGVQIIIEAYADLARKRGINLEFAMTNDEYSVLFFKGGSPELEAAYDAIKQCQKSELQSDDYTPYPGG